ncbi:YgaP family membrane protein [Maribacter litoralis]|uniref:YgaP family membrane protein n=1 Tax=Maribacter litoralis TaxID=2059726 RepID=UPI003F5CD117
MRKNLGSTDRFIRLFIAVALLTTFYTETVTGTLGYILAAVAGVLIFTTFISFCPIYSLFGASTCKTK